MTCWDNVFIGAAAMSLGPAYAVSGAVAAGRYDAREHELDAYRCVRVAEKDRLPEMVLSAARTAWLRSGLPGGELDLLLHASSWSGGEQGATAPRVGRGLGCRRATAWEVRRPSGGGLAALHVAAEYLSGFAGTPGAALITTGDSASAGEADRYRAQPGRVLGDGATGLVLTTGTGAARLLATTVAGEPPLDSLFRSDLPWRVPDADRPRGAGRRGHGSRALGADPDSGLRELAGVLGDREREVMRSALAECGRGVEEVARFVFPNLGRRLQGWCGRAESGIKESDTVWEWGRGVGHLPSGDQIAGLAHLLEEGLLAPGDTVVLVGGDRGRGFGCAVLEKL